LFFEIALRKYFPNYQHCHFVHGGHLLSALQQASHPYPDAIFLDVLMPLLSGPDTYKALQANLSWSAIPTCLLTASDDPSYFAEKHGINAQLVHTKPITLEAVRDLLLTYLPN
jgi:CheY-like chemotaxis protein